MDFIFKTIRKKSMHFYDAMTTNNNNRRRIVTGIKELYVGSI